jgi:hypothetical protein
MAAATKMNGKPSVVLERQFAPVQSSKDIYVSYVPEGSKANSEKDPTYVRN